MIQRQHSKVLALLIMIAGFSYGLSSNATDHQRQVISGFVYRASSGEYYLLHTRNGLEPHIKLVFLTEHEAKLSCISNRQICAAQRFTYVESRKSGKSIYDQARIASHDTYQEMISQSEIFGKPRR